MEMKSRTVKLNTDVATPLESPRSSLIMIYIVVVAILAASASSGDLLLNLMESTLHCLDQTFSGNETTRNIPDWYYSIKQAKAGSYLTKAAYWGRPVTCLLPGVLGRWIDHEVIFPLPIVLIALLHFPVPLILMTKYQLAAVIVATQGLLSGMVMSEATFLICRYMPIPYLSAAMVSFTACMYLSGVVPFAMLNSALICNISDWKWAYHISGIITLISVSGWTFVLLAKRRGIKAPSEDITACYRQSRKSINTSTDGDWSEEALFKFKRTDRSTSIPSILTHYDFYTICLAGCTAAAIMTFHATVLPCYMMIKLRTGLYDGSLIINYSLLIGSCGAIIIAVAADCWLQWRPLRVKVKVIHSIATLIPSLLLLLLAFGSPGWWATLVLLSFNFGFLLLNAITVLTTGLILYSQHKLFIAQAICFVMAIGSLGMLYLRVWLVAGENQNGTAGYDDQWKRLMLAVSSLLWVSWSFYFLIGSKMRSA